MQRFLNNYGGNRFGTVEANDSAASVNGFNWNDISVGNDTITGNRFFERRHPEHFKENGADVENIANDNEDNEFVSVEEDSENMLVPEQKKPLGQNNAKVPRAYLQIELQKKRQELKMKEIERKERERRQFHAKPAPNFQAIHRSQKRGQEEPKITIPKTPQVVRSHRKFKEISDEKQNKMLASLQPKPFVSKEADVLKVPPFVPRPKKKTPTEPAPFNLQSDERLRERREFDKKVEIENERKQKELEEKRRIEEETIRRHLRQQTLFKANPNPFSN